jgi:hypothetical protein
MIFVCACQHGFGIGADGHDFPTLFAGKIQNFFLLAHVNEELFGEIGLKFRRNHRGHQHHIKALCGALHQRQLEFSGADNHDFFHKNSPSCRAESVFADCHSAIIAQSGESATVKLTKVPWEESEKQFVNFLCASCQLVHFNCINWQISDPKGPLFFRCAS